VPINARVVLGKQEKELEVRDVSRSGIFLYCGDPPGQVGTILMMRLALAAGIKPVELKAEIVRVVIDATDKKGRVLGYGAQFVEVNASAQKELLNLLDRAMLGRGSARRIYPRVYQMIEIRARTKTEMKALLHDIGEGGVGLHLDRPLEKDEEVALEVSRGKNAPPMKFQARVVACAPTDGSMTSYRVGLRFAPFTPQIRNELQTFLKKMYSK
jgi:c-di-GMP-binding flagellar brake protein YcgR